MDATQRPIAFPPEFERYTEKHSIFQTFQFYLERLILERPEDPLKFLHKLLTSSITHAPKIIVLGPPAKQRSALCKELCGILNTAHITLELLEENLRKTEADQQDVQKSKAKSERKEKFKNMVSQHHKYQHMHPFFKTDAHSRVMEPTQEITIGYITEDDMEKCYEHSNLNEEIRIEENSQLEKYPGSIFEDEDELEIWQAKTGEIINIYVEEEKVSEEGEDTEGTTELQSDEVSEENKERNTAKRTEIRLWDDDDDEANLREMDLPDRDRDFQLDDESKLWIDYRKSKPDFDLETDDAEQEIGEESTEILEVESHLDVIIDSDFKTEKTTESPAETSKRDEEITFGKRSKIVTEFMKQIETQTCKERGWLTEGFPTTRLEAKTLQQWAVFPDHVVILNCPLDSSKSNDSEWCLYREEITGLSDCYKKYHCRSFRLDQSLQILSHEILKFVSSQPIYNTPYTPRILLLGLPGCGKTTQAMLLSEKYDIVNIDTKNLIPLAGLANDLQIIETIAQRMSLRDVLVCGYVLHGFPETFEQILQLSKAIEYRIPNRIIIIDISEKTSYDRLVHRRVDLTNHKCYHLLSNPPQSEHNVRLIHLREDKYDFIKNRIKIYRDNIEKIVNFFQGYIVRIDGETSVENVFEAILSVVVHPLPKT